MNQFSDFITQYHQVYKILNLNWWLRPIPASLVVIIIAAPSLHDPGPHDASPLLTSHL